MDSKERKRFKALIESEITKCEESIESLKELVKPVAPDNAIGRLSRMEALGEKAVNEANLGKAQIKLKGLQAARQRVETEDYGICVKCEEDIDTKRLEIVPETTICPDCIKKTV